MCYYNPFGFKTEVREKNIHFRVCFDSRIHLIYFLFFYPDIYVCIFTIPEIVIIIIIIIVVVVDFIY